MITETKTEKYRQAIVRRGVLPETPSATDYGPPAGPTEIPSSRSWLGFHGPVRDQGSEGSCAGYATLKTYEMEHLRTAGEQLDTSERFCYNLAKIVDDIPGDSVEQQGTTLRATAKVLRRYGVCDESDWPYVPGDRAHLEIARLLKILRKARKRRIAEYRNLLKRGVNESSLGIIKQALCRRVIVCGLLVHSDWFAVGVDGFVKPAENDPPSRAGGPSIAQPVVSGLAAVRREGGEWIGGHAVALASYDDNVQHEGRQGWFGFVNSWSEDWGDHGIGYIDYDSFIKALMSCYEIVL